jgi:hypothetical protein
MPSTSNSLIRTFKNEFINPIEVSIILFISFIYFTFTILLLNYRLTFSTILSNNPVSFKFTLLSSLIIGSMQSLGILDFILLVITALLVGTNLVIVFKNIKKLKKTGENLMLSAGGGAIIGVFVAGCSTCGFSLFALLGLTSAVTLFPFQGTLIGILIILLLAISLFYSLRKLANEVYCEIK